jgi:hypothetical protein
LVLKKEGPKPSGPGLELSFMEKRASLISSREKGRVREAAWDGVSEVDWTKEGRFRLSLAGRGVPRRDLKKP